MTDKIKRGNEGEKLATDYLKAKGFEIVERNYRYKHSEIDIIARRENWLVFVEVKTRSSSYFGFPEEFVDYQKVQTILKGADYYIDKSRWSGNVRYDIVSVIMKDGKHEIVHFEDAFY